MYEAEEEHRPTCPTRPTSIDGTLYLAPEGYEAELRAELGPGASPVVPGARLFLAPGPPRPVAWVANVWLDPVRVTFDSAADAARALRELGKNWALLPLTHFRRAALIAEQVPSLPGKPMVFPSPPPPRAGSWALVDPHVLFAAARCSSPFPHGEPRFVEDRDNPPSRAYLKLWEALTILGRRPGPGARCVDLGSSPGGWTWALERLGARVLSVDKAPLDPRVAALSRVKLLQKSAFSVDPASAGKVDWVVSDIVCYPARIVDLALRWLAAHPAASFVVTIKFQGSTDMTDVRRLREVPGARLLHLHNNKHELTWLRLAPAPAP